MVPSTAPMTPAPMPEMIVPVFTAASAPVTRTAPAKAPVNNRAANCTVTVRGGVLGSWSAR